MARYVGKRIVPKHCGYWDNAKEYEMESVVYDRASGNSYISRKTVPIGTDISQTEYWALCSDFNMQMDLLEQHITQSEAAIKADNDATEAAIRADNDATEQTILNSNSETEAAIRADNQATREHVDESLEETTTDLTQRVTAAQTAMTQQKASFDATAQQLNARMDEVLAAGTGDGSTEIADARVDADGNAYDSLGTHIRTAVAELKRTIDVSKNDINGLNQNVKGAYLMDGADEAAQLFMSNLIRIYTEGEIVLNDTRVIIAVNTDQYPKRIVLSNGITQSYFNFDDSNVCTNEFINSNSFGTGKITIIYDWDKHTKTVTKPYDNAKIVVVKTLKADVKTIENDLAKLSEEIDSLGNDASSLNQDVDILKKVAVLEEKSKQTISGIAYGAIYKNRESYITDSAKAYGYSYIQVNANKTYRVHIADGTTVIRNGVTTFFSTTQIEPGDSVADIVMLETQDYDPPIITLNEHDVTYTPIQDGYLYQYDQVLEGTEKRIKFYEVNESYPNVYDGVQSLIPEQMPINNRIGIVCSGSSITWGDGALDGSMVGELDEIIKNRLATTILYSRMDYTGGTEINNALMYKGKGIKLDGLNNAIEFDLYGDEIAICQMKRRSTDYGIMDVYADGVKIGSFDNRNEPKAAVENFTGTSISEVLLSHSCTYDHQIYINGSSSALANVVINTSGAGGTMPSGADAFVFRKPTDNGERNVHAIQFAKSLGTITSVSVTYKYGRIIAHEKSNVGQTADEYTNESYYGNGNTSYDPDKPSTGIGSGLEFRTIDRDSFFIHKFTNYAKRHYRVVIKGGVNPYMIINFATNRYFDLMNAGIGGWKLDGLIDNNSKLNKYTQFFKEFMPDFIYEEAMTNDDWLYPTRRIARAIDGVSLEDLKKIPQLEIGKITYNPTTQKYDIEMCTGIITSITSTSLISVDIVGTETQAGDIVRIGNYYGDVRQTVCRKITSVNLTTGEITWDEPLIADKILNVNSLSDLVGKEINIRNLEAYKAKYQTLIANIRKISPSCKFVIVNNGNPNYWTRQLWGYDIIHRELVQESNNVICIDAASALYDAMFDTIDSVVSELTEV